MPFDPNKSIGENRVRITFNPTLSTEIDEFKQTFAKLINKIAELPIDETKPGGSELARLKSIAMSSAEAACSDAVKAVTFYY